MLFGGFRYVIYNRNILGLAVSLSELRFDHSAVSVVQISSVFEASVRLLTLFDIDALTAC